MTEGEGFRSGLLGFVNRGCKVLLSATVVIGDVAAGNKPVILLSVASIILLLCVVWTVWIGCTSCSPAREIGAMDEFGAD